MCATVFYRKTIKGRLYPKAARTGSYAFAQEVTRVNGKVVTKYLGTVKVRKDVVVAEKGDVAETDASGNVVESGGEGNADNSG